MSNHSSIDQDTFQQLLANAFAVQESQISSQSLSAVMEVQRMLRNGNLNVDGAMHRLVESARNAANATGVAIALLKGGQLVYRAGSGSAATYVGRKVAASLTVSPDSERRREILRVEDAETDTRIEADICRQFGVQSLLILPIYDVRGLAGVLEVLFSEAHAFQHSEVRTYQLIARQIEVAILQAAPLEQKTAPVTQQPITPQVVAEVAYQQEGLFLNTLGSMHDPFPTNSISQRYGVALVAAREFLHNQSATLVKAMQIVTDVLWRSRQWKLAVAVVAVAISVTCWIAYHDRRPVSTLEPSSRPTSTPIDIQDRGQAAEALPEKAPSLGERSVKPTRQKFQRAKVGSNEVDYIGEDVTVRYFTYSSTPQRKPTSNGRVVYIGEDVTVRYFTPTPAELPGRR
ncbi:MAG TPA: GAF domain-containing protein [Candidatus Sulfotelmatobacter sp.]|nr:GAF domain-containing protein [Candidatus Sulfotelmatobacter sp.]